MSDDKFLLAPEHLEVPIRDGFVIRIPLDHEDRVVIDKEMRAVFKDAMLKALGLSPLPQAPTPAAGNHPSESPAPPTSR